MKNRRKALFFVALTQIVWPTSAAVPILLLDKFSNTQLLFFNSLAGLLIIIPIILQQKKTKEVKSILKEREDVFKLMLMGFIGVTLYISSLYQAYQMLSAQLAYSINLLWPVMTVFFSILILVENIGRKQLLGIFIAFIGVLLIISQGDISNFRITSWLGVLFSFLAASSYGLYSALGKKWNYVRVESLIYIYISSTLITRLALLFIHGGLDIPTVTIFDVLGFIWIGGFILALGDLFWFLALKYGNTAELSSIAMIGPFIAFFWIYLLLGEPIAIFSIVGMSVVLTGNYFSRHRETN